jgi:ribosomal protein S18 acetylase RimI-like enzyme
MTRANLDAMPPTIAVHLEHTADAVLVDRLTELINTVYETAEAGLWRNGATRTTASQLAQLIETGEMAVATVDGEIAGAVRVHLVSDDTGEFGMLAAAPEHRGLGVGRALVQFAEQHSREQGMRAMQLELLVPRTWRHPSKVFLDGWYRRIGYEVVRTTSLDENYPELAPLLATECDLLVYRKTLA